MTVGDWYVSVEHGSHVELVFIHGVRTKWRNHVNLRFDDGSVVCYPTTELARRYRPETEEEKTLRLLREANV